jgi:hypothetical protein
MFSPTVQKYPDQRVDHSQYVKRKLLIMAIGTNTCAASTKGWTTMERQLVGVSSAGRPGRVSNEVGRSAEDRSFTGIDLTALAPYAQVCAGMQAIAIERILGSVLNSCRVPETIFGARRCCRPGADHRAAGRVLQKLKPDDVAVGTKVWLTASETGLARLQLDRVDITEHGGGGIACQ